MEHKFDFDIYVKEKTKPMAKKIVVPKATIDKLRHRVTPDKIVISPFEVLNNYPNSPEYDYNNTSEDYIFVNARLLSSFFDKCNPTMFKIVNYIMYSLKCNSNVVIINQRQLAAMLGDWHVFYYIAIERLEELGVIAKTNVFQKYIINHNVIFKGNLNEFAKEYKEKYGGIPVTVNELGKVIIDNRSSSDKYRNREILTIEDFKRLNSPKEFVNKNLIGGTPVFGKYSDKKVRFVDDNGNYINE